MRRPVRFVLAGMLVAFVAQTANAASCSVRKGLYDAWLSSAKHAAHTAPKIGALVASASTLPTPDTSSAQEIAGEYQAFFQCLSDAAPPAGEESATVFCKAAAADRLAALVCQVALYIKTGRTGAKDLIDVLPNNKKAAEMIWDLDAIVAATGAKPDRG